MPINCYLLGIREKGDGDIPSESAAQEPVPLPVVSVVYTEIGIQGRRGVVCVEAINVVRATEIRVACSSISELDQGSEAEYARRFEVAAT